MLDLATRSSLLGPYYTYNLKILPIVFLLLVFLVAQTVSGAPNKSLTQIDQCVEQHKGSEPRCLSHLVVEPVPYPSKSVIRSRQTDQVAELILRFLDWQVTHASPTTIAELLAAYTAIWDFVADLGSDLLTKKTAFTLKYGNLRFTIVIGHSIGQRAIGLMVPTPEDILRKIVKTLRNYALKGLVGLCRVAYFVGKTALLAMIIGGLTALAPQQSEAIAVRLNT